MVALYTCWYKFARVNSTVRMSPAMACGLEQRLWDIDDIVKLLGKKNNAGLGEEFISCVAPFLLPL